VANIVMMTMMLRLRQQQRLHVNDCPVLGDYLSSSVKNSHYREVLGLIFSPCTEYIPFRSRHLV
jgi:hypothetical protein